MADVVDAVVVKPTARDRLKSAALAITSPPVVATLTLFAGLGLAVAGVFVLFGLGWALLAGAAPLLLLAAVLIRGLLRVG